MYNEQETKENAFLEMATSCKNDIKFYFCFVTLLEHRSTVVESCLTNQFLFPFPFLFELYGKFYDT